MKCDFNFTYLVDSFLRLIDLAELDVAIAEELVIMIDRHLAAENLAEIAELGVEILSVPAKFLEALHKYRGGLDVTTTGLASDGVQVVGQGSAHETTFNARESEFCRCLFSILDALKHDERIVEVLEEWSARKMLESV